MAPNPLQGIQPLQPTATELVNWNVGRNNARNTYNQALAGNQFERNKLNQNYGTQQRQMNYGFQQNRQGFDDPYIARGMFNSGVRNAGLADMYTRQGFQRGNAEQQYLDMLGGLGQSDTFAGINMNNTIGNIDLQEQARRTDLASQIKGIA